MKPIPTMKPKELREAMASLGYPDNRDGQKMLASRIGVHPRTVQKYLYGECEVPPPIALLIRMLLVWPVL